MKSELITVVETASFLADAKACMTDDERIEAINMIAAHPECGDLISGGGGIRKVRFATGGKGKSGGVRIIYLLPQRTGADISTGGICQERPSEFDKG